MAIFTALNPLCRHDWIPCLRGNNRTWGVQRGEAPLRSFFLSPEIGGLGVDVVWRHTRLRAR